MGALGAALLAALMACSPRQPAAPARSLLEEIVEVDLSEVVRQAEGDGVTRHAEVVSRWEFDGIPGEPTWTAQRDAGDHRIADGLLAGITFDTHPSYRAGLDHPADPLDYLWLRVKVEWGGGGAVRWRAPQRPGDPGRGSIRFDLTGGDFEDLVLPVGGSPAWSGRVRRLDLHLPRKCGSYAIDFVRLIRASGDRMAGVPGLAQTPGKALIAGESRLSLLAPPPSQLPWRLAAPARGRLVLSYGILPDAWARPGSSVRFRVTAGRGDGGRQELLADTLDPRHEIGDRRWVETVVELDEAGPLDLRFTTEAGNGESPFGYAVWGNPRWIPESAAADRPHIVLIAIDTLRADRIGAYGYPQQTTPHLDRFAAAATRFDNAWSQAPWSLPSYGSLFTSRVPSMTGVTGRPRLLPPEAMTLARHLHEAGYATVALTNGGYAGLHFGMHRGFELFWEGTEAAGLSARLEEVAGTLAGRPHLVYLHTYELHDHFQKHDRHLAEVRPPAPGTVPTPADEASRIYDGALRVADAAFGRWMEVLERQGLLDNAVVVVFSDHGEALLERRRSGHGHSLYEELLHVPLLIRRYGGEATAPAATPLANMIDIAPTVLELAGVERPAGMQGRSLVPDLEGAPAAAREGQRRPIGYAELHRYGQFARRDGDLKYIYTAQPEVCAQWGVPPAAGGAYCEELYDLSVDGGERDNLAAGAPRRLAAARAGFLRAYLELTPGLRLLARGPAAGAAASIRVSLSAVEPLFDENGHFYLEPGDRVSGATAELELAPGDVDLVSWLPLPPDDLVRAAIVVEAPAGHAPPRLFGGRDCSVPVAAAGPVGLAETLVGGSSEVALPAAHSSGSICFFQTEPVGARAGVGEPSPEALERLRAHGYLD